MLLKNGLRGLMALEGLSKHAHCLSLLGDSVYAQPFTLETRFLIGRMCYPPDHEDLKFGSLRRFSSQLCGFSCTCS